MTELTSWHDKARSRLAAFAAERAASQAAYASLSDRCTELRLAAQRLAEQAEDHRRAAAHIRGDNGPTLARADQLQREAEAARRAYEDAERQRQQAEQRSQPVIRRAGDAKRILLALGVISGQEAA